MIHKACMPVYMNSGKIVAGGRDGWRIEGSTRGPRGPKKQQTNGSNNDYKLLTKSPCNTVPTTCNNIIGICTYFYGVSKYHFEKYFSSFQNIIIKTKTFAQPKRRRSQEGM